MSFFGAGAFFQQVTIHQQQPSCGKMASITTVAAAADDEAPAVAPTLRKHQTEPVSGIVGGLGLSRSGLKRSKSAGDADAGEVDPSLRLMLGVQPFTDLTLERILR